MTRTTGVIPVDIKNPGQVLACMGFIEAAEVLCGGVDAHFDWSEARTRFVLSVDGDTNPFEVVLGFLATAKVIKVTPIGYVEGDAADGDDDGEGDVTASESEDDRESEARGFPAGEGDRNALPVRLVHTNGRRLTVSHWAEKRRNAARPWLSRNHFKLYSGNRSARQITLQLLSSLREIWRTDPASLAGDPLGRTVPLGGSFNFDAGRAWTGIDAGFSPDQQKKNGRMIAGVAGSPAVEVLAAIGLEHARPNEYEKRKVRYAVWGSSLPPMLARAALSGADLKVPMRRLQFQLSGTKHSPIVTFAQEETQP